MVMRWGLADKGDAEMFGLLLGVKVCKIMSFWIKDHRVIFKDR